VRAADVDHSAAPDAAAVAVIDAPAPPAAPRTTGIVRELRALAIEGLERMYDREARRFAFRVRPDRGAIVREGHSVRYTAMSLIGLAGEPSGVARQVLRGASIQDVARRLVDEAEADRIHNLGDLAVTAWAAASVGCATDRVWARIVERGPDSRPHPTVEVAWTLSALTVDRTAPSGDLAHRLADQLMSACTPGTRIFPHRMNEPRRAGGRAHVACFADLVYPTLALAQYGAAERHAAAIDCASRSAATMCRLQGAAGQWWWHFDYRTGRVLEKYPVYAVHQDSMAPMALFAAAEAADASFDAAIARGLDWLQASPEIGGRSLVDRSARLIWRKVARREPRKLSRYLQAAVSGLSPSLRAPGLDVLFPPTAIDYEDRPYHLGWVLYAWPAQRAARWASGGAA
jgi:hypothetical protein